MNIAESNLKAIADAIREKDNTTAAICACDFAKRIKDIPTGNSFPDDVCYISANSNIANGGTAIGGGYASKGMTVILNAENSPGYNFEGWKENEEIISINNQYTFTVTKNREFIAMFHQETPSRLPEDYTELEYFTTKSGTSILTDVKVNPHTARVVCDIEPIEKVTAYIAYIFNATSSSVGGSYLGLASQSDKIKWFAGSITSAGDVNRGELTYDLNKDVRVLIDMDSVSKKIKIGTNVFNFSPASNNGNVSLRFGWIYGSTTTAGLHVNFYSAKIYVSGELKGDFVPCKKSNGRIGLFNLVTNTFCGNNSNANDSEPIAGPSLN